MQRANDITIEAYRAALATLKEGMTQFEFQSNIRAAFQALGVPGGSASVQFGKYTAFPHGSSTPQKLQQGDVVLVDGGCNVEGYQSDITRTTVFGKPSQRQIDVWNLEKKAQAAAFAAAARPVCSPPQRAKSPVSRSTLPRVCVLPWSASRQGDCAHQGSRGCEETCRATGRMEDASDSGRPPTVSG